ncbi:MAG: glucans biosynthesis glucosyltransferase MdoH [Xanthobacteraceae bacterium]|nr:glucans biosynthesis glucosyltransferase MdoH [Xanthobacteraceae bacterium]QYK45757.1 MAG: glucans biosynthesis glucosyltransferase MdoH [Xanthobacteraceae bacterium]
MSMNSSSAEAAKPALGVNHDAATATAAGIASTHTEEMTPTGTQSVRAIARRRMIYAALVTATLFGMAAWLVHILSYDGFGFLDAVLVACFLVYAPWIVTGFWNSVIGFFIMNFVKDPLPLIVPVIGKATDADPVFAKTAILMTVRNEDPARAFARLRVIKQSLDRTGQADKFDFFVLSDSNRPEVFPLEEAAAAAWAKDFPGPSKLVYRRRDHNEGYKAGNVRDFCERWGNEYELMIPLDADSIMTGETIVRMVRIHQANPRLGILQSLIVGMPSKSFFARVFQFGMRGGMRAYTSGYAWWHAECGPFWGHNTTIRIQPFRDYCKLPLLPGKPPFGGHILSHDHIESMMMRRAGFEVRVIPEEVGSFEETPPTLLDFEARDVRWANGNLQYTKLLNNMPGLQPTSWMQMLLAIQMFVGMGAVCLFAIVAAIGVALAPAGGQFPYWSAFFFYALFIALYISPRVLGVFDAALRSVKRYGGAFKLFASGAMDMVFTFLHAPLQMFAASYFMVAALFGRKTRWDGQQRDGYRVPWKAAMRTFWPHTLFGAAIFLFVLWFSPFAAIWFVPFVAGLILAAPFAVFSSLPWLGAWAERNHYCVMPEELDMPEEIRAVQAPAAA